MSVVAIVFCVAEANTSVTARSPHLLNKIYHDPKNVGLETNLRRRLVASGESGAHQRLLPPARGLVLRIVPSHLRIESEQNSTTNKYLEKLF